MANKTVFKTGPVVAPSPFPAPGKTPQQSRPPLKFKTTTKPAMPTDHPVVHRESSPKPNFNTY